MIGEKQLPLPFAAAPFYAAEDFLEAPNNMQAREMLANGVWSYNRLSLWGDSGCGKTHLLHIWARQTGATLRAGPDLRAFSDLPAGPLAIDDADLTPDETTLLHLLNAAAPAPVLLTMRLPPARQDFALNDLASRLRASSAVEIKPPGPDLLAALLTRLTAARQISLPIPVETFLLTRLERSPAALREAVARLDRAALDRGTKVTRVFAAELLADLTAPQDEGSLYQTRHAASHDRLL